MIYNKTLLGVLLALFFFVGTSCSDDDDDDLLGNWVEKSDFEGLQRANSSLFTIGNKAYLVGGFDGDDYFSDLWEYDVDLNFWKQKAAFPGVARSGGVAFSVDGKGYFGTGYDGDLKLADFYEYDPSTDKWMQIADFGGSARYEAVAFVVGGNGYVGCGYNGSDLKDMWKYTASSNSWEQVVSVGGSKRRSAAAFVIDDIAYVGTGINNGVYEDDFWSYDYKTGTWTQLADLDVDDDYYLTRSNATAFAINGKGYLVSGYQSGIRGDVWEYSPLTDTWVEKTSLEGSVRYEAVGFAMGEKGFIATGGNGSYYFDDIWCFYPTHDYSEDD